MTLKKFENPAGSRWSQDLKTDDELNLSLPLNFFLVTNNSDIAVNVKMWGKSVGNVERYSSNTFVGVPYESFEISNVNDATITAGELIVHCGRDVSITQMPFNPQIDLMQDNFDRFASGCDSRLSSSPTVTVAMIKYWINVSNDLIVMRRLDLAGTAVMGSYNITFGVDSIISGSVPVNGTALDTKQYRKTISGSSFDYTVSDCTIAGLMVDYVKKLGDISGDYTEVVCIGGSISLSYDDDLTTSTHTGNIVTGTGWSNMWEVSFSSRTISDIHSFFKLYAYNAYTAYCKIQLNVNSVWTDTGISVSNDGTVTYGEHDNTSYDLVTGIRFMTGSSASGYGTDLWIYDISAF